MNNHYIYRAALVALAFGCAVTLAAYDHPVLAAWALAAGIWRTVRT